MGAGSTSVGEQLSCTNGKDYSCVWSWRRSEYKFEKEAYAMARINRTDFWPFCRLTHTIVRDLTLQPDLRYTTPLRRPVRGGVCYRIVFVRSIFTGVFMS